MNKAFYILKIQGLINILSATINSVKYIYKQVTIVTIQILKKSFKINFNSL